MRFQELALPEEEVKVQGIEPMFALKTVQVFDAAFPHSNELNKAKNKTGYKRILSRGGFASLNIHTR